MRPSYTSPHQDMLPASWRSISRSCLPLLLILALFAGMFVRPAQAATTDTRVLPQLQNEAAANPSKLFRVIVTRVNKNTQADSAVKTLGGAKIKEVAAESFVATLPGGKIAALGQNTAVKFVAPDAVMLKTGTVDATKLSSLFPQVVKATGLWSGTNPITGQGIGVAILDTGINVSRADWKSATSSTRITATAIFNANTKAGNDGHGHGTHVAGIVAGNSWYNGATSAGKYIGIAPEANIINVKVADDTGMSYVSDVVNAIDWVIANRQTYNIRVMNLSLVSSVAESATTSTLTAAVERAWFNGIFVVVAAGNTGPDTMQYPPANDPFVMTVGAADPMTTVTTSDDTIAPWSSYGTTQDGHAKPEVVAPGRYITSMLSSSTSTIGVNFKDRIVDSNYVWMSGTSMAAPVVAGVAALAFQAHPEWTNDQVKWLLMNTAAKLGTTTITGSGSGEVDATAVVRYVGTPGYANQGLTINQLLTTTSGGTTYDSASWSTANWSTANWSTANWSTANWSTANWSTASWSSATEKGVQ